MVWGRRQIRASCAANREGVCSDRWTKSPPHLVALVTVVQEWSAKGGHQLRRSSAAERLPLLTLHSRRKAAHSSYRKTSIPLFRCHGDHWGWYPCRLVAKDPPLTGSRFRLGGGDSSPCRHPRTVSCLLVWGRSVLGGLGEAHLLVASCRR